MGIDFILVNMDKKERVENQGFRVIGEKESSLIHFALKEYWRRDKVILVDEMLEEYESFNDVTSKFMDEFEQYWDFYKLPKIN